MRLLHFFREGIVFSALSLLLLCCSCHNRGWIYEEQPKRGCRSASLAYEAAQMRSQALALQLIKTKSGLTAYLSRHAGTFPHNVEKEVVLYMKTAAGTTRCTAYGMEGGQQCRLSNEMTEKIISHLQAGEKVLLYRKGARVELTPENFSSLYQKMMKR